ncbi:ABC transporter ATP-binding protein [Stappia stellulata]|uniref:ABC transporter ATP-binding protein n=1 Tax=Stappia stellulata TaxID=71235 RepID=UPI001CD58CE8|nr:ABC transporter ATP-binding protein [Stappia stellulata]MCA1241481.1 ABC transporter ATP-binding protein [Stappia stellulata]
MSWTSDPILVVDGLVKRFGGNVAVNQATLEVGRGTIVGLIGINGAGKSTLMNCIAGMYRADEGRVEFDGQNLIGLTPHEIAAAGIGRTFQVPRTFERLTLIDNLMIPMLNRPESEDELIALAEAGLAEVNLHDLKMNNGEELSGGQQKLLELARVMMLEPKLILLDEPFAGVNPTLCTLITDKILQMKEAGISFLLVSHDLTSIYRLSDHIYVLNQGEVICEGGVDDIRDDPKVVEAYLGG